MLLELKMDYNAEKQLDSAYVYSDKQQLKTPSNRTACQRMVVGDPDCSSPRRLIMLESPQESCGTPQSGSDLSEVSDEDGGIVGESDTSDNEFDPTKKPCVVHDDDSTAISSPPAVCDFPDIQHSFNVLPQPILSVWNVAYSESGQPYYWNSITQQTTWELPVITYKSEALRDIQVLPTCFNKRCDNALGQKVQCELPRRCAKRESRSRRSRSFSPPRNSFLKHTFGRVDIFCPQDHPKQGMEKKNEYTRSEKETSIVETQAAEEGENDVPQMALINEKSQNIVKDEPLKPIAQNEEKSTKKMAKDLPKTPLVDERAERIARDEARLLERARAAFEARQCLQKKQKEEVKKNVKCKDSSCEKKSTNAVAHLRKTRKSGKDIDQTNREISDKKHQVTDTDTMERRHQITVLKAEKKKQQELQEIDGKKKLRPDQVVHLEQALELKQQEILTTDVKHKSHIPKIAKQLQKEKRNLQKKCNQIKKARRGKAAKQLEISKRNNDNGVSEATQNTFRTKPTLWKCVLLLLIAAMMSCVLLYPAKQFEKTIETQRTFDSEDSLLSLLKEEGNDDAARIVIRNGFVVVE